jgi:hypothetical protein
VGESEAKQTSERSFTSGGSQGANEDFEVLGVEDQNI